MSSAKYEAFSYPAGSGSVSIPVWAMIIIGCFLVYIPGVIYRVEIYLRTVDDDGIPDEAMYGEPLRVIAIRYGVGLTSKMYDYVSMAGRSLSILGACILSLSFYYSRRLLVQMFMVVVGYGAMTSVKPILYYFRDSTEDRLVVPFNATMSAGYVGFLLLAIAVYWADIFYRVSSSSWVRLTLSTIVVMGAFLWTSSVLVGAISCSNGGTFMPEVVTFAVSFWISFLPFMYLFFRTGLRIPGPGEDIPYYTPESTPMLPEKNHDETLIKVARD